VASACEVSFSETGQVAIGDQDTCDLYRVNFEVNNLKPFTCLAFPHSIDLKTGSRLPGFDGELMASFSDSDAKGQAGSLNPVSQRVSVRSIRPGLFQLAFATGPPRCEQHHHSC
jgi:hypothetical protein